MKILYLTRYSRKGASSRLRFYQYIPYLEKAGIKVSVSALLDDLYLDRLYQGKSVLFLTIKSYLYRFYVLLSYKKYDKLFIEKELFPYLPSWIEQLLSFIGVKYIVDYDDATFHTYDLHPSKIIRVLLHNKIDKVMLNSYTVIAGNSYLANRAKKAGALHIEIIPTVVDMNRYQQSKYKENDKVIIGWVGSPSTFKYIQSIQEVLKQMVVQHNVAIHIIGAKGDLGFSENLHFIEWHEDTEVENISKFDIGIMPLEDSPWEQGKCAYKLIQYMACGIPVVASAVGMNKDVVKEHITGFLATTPEHWIVAFETYIKDRNLRIINGCAGFQKVLDEFSLESSSIKLNNILIQ